MLVGREKEFAKIESLILNSLKSRSPLSIYISGPPGTGKTATVNAVTQSLLKKQRRNLLNVSIDCFASFTITALSRSILDKLDVKSVQNKRVTQGLEEHFAKSRKAILILLDEVDNLVSQKGKIISTAFNWPTKYPGKIIIIGISNSLDLTERVISKHNFTNPPQTLVFPAYTGIQLTNILGSLLGKENVDSKALELCARKVSSMTGDVRQALDIATQMLLTMEKESEEEEEKENNCSNLLMNSLKTPEKRVEKTPEKRGSLKRPLVMDAGLVTPKKNACREVLNALNKTTASPCQRSKLPQHPSIILATLMRLINNSSTQASAASIYRTPPRRTTPNGKSAAGTRGFQEASSSCNAVTRDRLFQAYIQVCERLFLKPLDSDELSSAYELLESQAMIKFTGPGKQRVCFIVEMAMACQAINDNALLASIENLDV